jgi:hypothetical protein
MATAAASAAVTDFKVETDPTVPVNGPIPVGNEFTCTPIYDNNFDPVASYDWQIQYDYGLGCVSLWTGVGANETLFTSSTVPVSLQIKLTVKYSSVFTDDPNNPLPAHADTVITKNIVVQKADNVKLPADGANVATDRDTQVELSYEVRRGTHDCTLIAGLAQEKITNRVFMGIPFPDGDWVPAAPSPTFGLGDGYISDTHWLALTDAQWNATAVNGVIESATQQLRIVWSDPCGNLHTDQVLNNVGLVHRKVSNTQWKVETN